jgi:ribosomal RNA-processing protein 9
LIHNFTLSFFLKLGSWEGDIRIWKIDAKLNSFSLVGKISAPGVVNSLQLLTMPKGFSKTIAWGSSASSQAAKELVLVAGLGQEHKLGRWLTVKEGGAVNQGLVVVV